MVEIDPEIGDQRLLTITENGYGKRSPLSEYRQQNRGGSGIIDIRTGERNGAIVGSLIVEDTDKIMLISESGQIIKVPVLNIRDQSRNTKGVTVMRVPEGDRIVSIAKVLEDDDEESSVEETTVDPTLSADQSPEASE